MVETKSIHCSHPFGLRNVINYILVTLFCTIVFLYNNSLYGSISGAKYQIVYL